MKKIYLQGDIALFPITKGEFFAVQGEKVKHDGRFVLAYGESTGHKHQVQVAEPKQMEIVKDANGNYFFHFMGEARLTHEEHGTHIIAPGFYRFGEKEHEQEYDYFALATRRVLD